MELRRGFFETSTNLQATWQDVDSIEIMIQFHGRRQEKIDRTLVLKNHHK